MPQLIDEAPAEANGQPNGEPARTLPFVSGARPSARIFHDESNALVSAASTQVGPVPVIAAGFLRHILLYVTLSGGAGGSAVASDRGPYAALERVRLQDTSGATIVDCGGHDLYLANKYLPVAPSMPDPSASPAFSAVDADGDATFIVRVPVEVSGRDGFGALANQSASQTYQLEYVQASGSDIYDTPPATTLPTMRVRAFLEYWSPPQGSSPSGMPIAATPPAHGSVQFVRTVPYDVDGGDQQLRITRVGNFFRAIIAIKEDDSGDLDTAGLPAEVELSYDHNQVEKLPSVVHRDRTARQYGLTAAEGSPNGPDAGVLVWQWDDDLDGTPGWGSRRQYLATTVATDLRLIGDFESAGRVRIITVDVAPSGPFMGK